MAPTEVKRIIIPSERSPGYRDWIETGANALRERLPFQGPADVSITTGSGIGIVEHLGLQDTVVIPFADVGLPCGPGAEGHLQQITAGVANRGIKTIVFQGRKHAYEIPPQGIDTDYGNLSRMELATGYLAMLDQVGAEVAILTCASGGINHPLQPAHLKPFNNLPMIGLIASDSDMAYESVHMGPYRGYGREDRFYGLKDADEELMSAFEKTMRGLGYSVPRVHYITSPSTPSFEDRANVYQVALNGGQVVGMSYSPEKKYLSGARNIKRFLGITVVTNAVELIPSTNDVTAGYGNAISVEEMRNHHPWQFKLASIASHEEVQERGRMANTALGKGLHSFIQSLN